MTTPLATVVIVDPVGSAAFIAPYFLAAGWRCVAVLSSKKIPSVFTSAIQPELYSEIVIAENGLKSLLGRLCSYDVCAVIAGIDTAVELADAISAFYGLAGNDPQTSRCRFDKGVMGACLQGAGVPVAEQIVTRHVRVLTDWAMQSGRLPVVIKPTRSAGSDNVMICHTQDEVRVAFSRIMGKLNKLGATNDAVLGQEFLKGQQYLVNTVSIDGSHYISEIWQFDATFCNDHQIYDKQKLLAANGSVQDILADYTMRVLDVLGIRFGPGHTELMLTSDGPKLIECAARMTGKIGQKTLLSALGHHHISLCCDCYLKPDMVLARMPRYKLQKAVSILALQAPCAGRIVRGAGLATILKLPTYVECIGGQLEAGVPVSETVDLFTSPGLIYLLGPSEESVESDMAVIRRIEKSGGLYSH